MMAMVTTAIVTSTAVVMVMMMVMMGVIAFLFRSSLFILRRSLSLF